MSSILQDPRLNWLSHPDIRPYVFVRPENRIPHPGELHEGVDWFPHEVIYKNPLQMDEVGFANYILNLEGQAFGAANMAMPRWVFYDCAIVPGFVAGFAARAKSLKPQVLQAILKGAENQPNHQTALKSDNEWVPLSLFIIIPTMSNKGEWVAHNLCSVNSLIAKEDQFYGIGFISKAFGLWYANVRTCCGMTQWTSPSLKLHSNYGDFEILTSYTPVHTYAQTLTYRLTVQPERWAHFFNKNEAFEDHFHEKFAPAGFAVDPKDEKSLMSFQKKLENSEGPFFLNSSETLAKPLTDPHKLYIPRFLDHA